MKRRLSVAISLIGAPKVAYLDEPSTGLDPASRRNLWGVIKEAKAGKAVVLTTHSMEEAEVLCDRLGIFVAGRLVCLGNPKQLTARYGGYYVRTSPSLAPLLWQHLCSPGAIRPCRHCSCAEGRAFTCACAGADDDGAAA